MLELVAVLVMVMGGTYVLTGWTRDRAVRQGILDLPNERSSHSQPTPRGGGIAIAITSSLAIGWFAFRHWVDPNLAAAFIGGGSVIATAGYFDDRDPLPAGLRFLAHIGAAAWAMYMLGGLPPLRFGSHVISLGVWGYAIGLVAIVWVLNLFNFMDGIDGIAASEAAFVAGFGGALAIAFSKDFAVGYGGLAIAAAALSFLVWNWPPAKIFMGDVGSGYLGFCIAVLALAGGRSSSVGSLAWLILGSVFFVDATTTLFIRLTRGERVYLAHRDHVYQRLAKRWGLHRPVTLLVCAVNLGMLLPGALFALARPDYAAEICASALVILSLALLWLRVSVRFRP